MASDAAEKQVHLGAWAAALSGFGLILLVWTLYGTWRTAKAAIAGVKRARDEVTERFCGKQPKENAVMSALIGSFLSGLTSVAPPLRATRGA